MAAVAEAPSEVMQDSLWAGRKIPVILISGDINSGKSLFALNIDPNCRRRGVAPTTRVWDNEGSCDSYESLNFDRRDVREAVYEGLHMKQVQAREHDPKWRKIILTQPDVNDSPAASLFRAWYLDLLQTPRGQFRVGVVDTFTPIQDGLVEWLKKHPEALGRTPSQYANASSMFLWPDVKSILTYILATDCRLRFETFVMTVHMKNEWANGAKTGHKVAEGLDTLNKLSMLHLQLDRTAPAKGSQQPAIPAAEVIKQRLVEFSFDATDEDRPILPPRLPKATPAMICHYILNPPDYSHLGKGEKAVHREMSEEEKLRIQAQIAENNRLAAEAHAQQSLANFQREQMERARLEGMRSPGAGPAQQPMITPAQYEQITALFPEAFSCPEEVRAYLDHKGIGKLADITEAAATDLMSAVLEIKARRQQQAAADKLAATETAPDTQAEQPPPPLPASDTAVSPAQDAAPAVNKTTASDELVSFPPDEPITPEQRELIMVLFGETQWSHESQKAWLAAHSLGTFRNLTAQKAGELMNSLRVIKRIQQVAKVIGWDEAAARSWLAPKNLPDLFAAEYGQLNSLLETLIQTELAFRGNQSGN